MDKPRFVAHVALWLVDKVESQSHKSRIKKVTITGVFSQQIFTSSCNRYYLKLQ